MNPVEVDVLVVGAGPTGLALATALQEAGVVHQLIDALPQGLNTSRAAVIHPHTLEMLDRLGVGPALKAEGLPIRQFTVRDRDVALLRIAFDRLPSAYRHILMLPQSRTEAILASRYAELGGLMLREGRAIDVRQSGDHVDVRVDTPNGERSYRARFVVAGDGMRSLVRESTSIRFEGEAYGESFVLADVRMDWPLGQTEVSLCFSPAGLVVVAPLPDGSFRIVATVDNAPEHPTLADIQRLLDERGPANNAAKVREIGWSSRFRVHHRLASAYREGRILLMGDAAHVHSPAGGQGMNAGLVDAIVVGEALTSVVRDGAPLTLLDGYAAARRPAAAQVLSLASRLTRLATVRSRPVRMARNLLLRLLDHVAPFKKKLALQLSGISRRGLSTLPRP